MGDNRTGPTVAQIKEDIAGSRQAGKINAFDPAAAPLGTDDESAGMPPGSQDMRDAHRREAARGRDDDHPISAQPGRHWRPYPIYLVGAAITLAFLAILISARF